LLESPPGSIFEREMPRSVKKKPVTKVRVGKEVGVRLGGHVLPALVVEDRGNLGPGGTQIVRVELMSKEPDLDREPTQFEVSVNALVGAPA
jgi:hypothetical protein